jgi:ABC-2 type transport system ATP-binding protein
MTQASTDTIPTPDAEPAREPSSDDIIVKGLGLTKTFKDFWLRDKVRAVDAIDFEIFRGEVFGLLGPNGSGKSTTIKMILGLLHPTDGKLAVFGNLPRDVQTKKRIGYLPEETYLYKFLTPTETLEYYAKLFHLNRATRKKRIGMLLDMVGLEHAANRPVGEFSKGMMRKVGLAQALINDPEFLILDEPTSGMDPIATDDVKKVIRQLRDRGKTILLCSHLLADVQDVCDRVAMMFGGKIRREGGLDGLLQVQDKTTITTSTLDNISDEQIVAVLEKLGVTDVALDHPRRTLEQVFLEMVEEAHQEGLETFGARSGRDVAAFLQGDEDEPTSEARVEKEREVLIESLVTGDAPASDPQPSDTPQAEAQRSAASGPTPQTPTPQTPTTQPPSTPPPPATTETDSVLADLTGDAKTPSDEPKPPPSAPPAKPATKTDPKSKSDADSGVIDDLLNG